jgi:tetratricopeptide (TPR) repeat protein
MIRFLLCFATLFLSVVPVKARTVELTLSPAKAPEPAEKYRLLPAAHEQKDVDAFSLYEKAIHSLPENYNGDKISQWRSMPLKDLPVEQVRATLQTLAPMLRLLQQAALSKECKWPVVEPDQVTDKLTDNLSKYRQLAFILAVQGRLEIAQGQYDQAVATVRTGFVMARHLGQAPTLIQGLVGVAIGALMCAELEQLVQAPDGPSLYWALQSLPRPYIDLTKQMEFEEPDIKERIRLLMNRLDRHLAALQCVEALRLYAANHNGKFPNELTDVTEVALPNDPFTQKPFVYSRTGSRAVLEGTAPEGGTAKDAIRYVLNLKR